jgi:hypothetical protein
MLMRHKRNISAAILIVLSAAFWNGCGKAHTSSAVDSSTPPVVTAAKTGKDTDYPVSFPEPETTTTAKETHPGSIQFMDLKNGFRDAAFGMEKTNFTNLILAERDESGQFETYTRTGDILSLKGTPLESIAYSFFQGQLYRITLKWNVTNREGIHPSPQAENIAGNCSTLYGRPKRSSKRPEGSDYYWLGKRVQIILTEIRAAGVTNSVQGGWAIPPTAAGQMVLESVPLREVADIFGVNQKINAQDGF